MSRRDEVVDTLDNVLTSLRANLSAVLPESHPITRRLASVLDLPPAASVSAPPTASTSRLPTFSLAPPPGTTSALHPRHESIPLASGSGSASPDELPAYSRRAPTQAEPEIPKRLHVYSSKSKLKLEVMSAGEAFLVLVQDLDADRVWLEGKLTVTLPSPEAITGVKLRLKGIVRTLVLKDGRHPITDEVQIWEDAISLWSEGSPNLPGNESTDPSKLQGTFTFPFRVHLPAKVPKLQFPGQPPKLMPVPPSFVLGGVSRAGVRGSEWASVRFFLKVTLGRKGLLKSNERLIVPIIYLPRRPEPRVSPLRLIAQAAGQAAPGPLDDPAGWLGKRVRHPVKRGVFTGRKAWYEVVLLTPSPAKFSRLSTLDIAIKVRQEFASFLPDPRTSLLNPAYFLPQLLSSDPTTTTNFPGSSITVFVLQRALVTAQGISAQHDLVVAQGTIISDGPSEGENLRAEGPDPATWGKNYRGTIQLTHTVSSSFRAPNLSLAYFVGVHVIVPGAGNNVELLVPIEIIAAARSSLPRRWTRASGEGEPGATELTQQPPLDDEDAMGLPPSYFEALDLPDAPASPRTS